jgi:hypothetical protein
VKVRIRMPELSEEARAALERKARLFLGRHVATIESVQLSAIERTSGGVEHADCELTVRLRDGLAIRVHDDADHIHRVFLRAAWRIDQRRELGKLLGDSVDRAS